MGVFTKNLEDSSGEKNGETIIGSTVKIEGSFISKDDILIQGQVIGNLTTEGNLNITTGAKIQADIEANNIVIAGEVTGNIKCAQKVELEKTARIIGDIETQILSVETGAMLQGRCITQDIKNSDPVNKPNKEESKHGKK